VENTNTKIFGKALKNLRFIRHVVGGFSDEKVKEGCYFALARPHLDSAASIWDPEQKDLIKELDKIQRKSACFEKKNFFGRIQSVSKLLEELNWEPLRTRRLCA
jgi:hypothetical protein